jgi:hypothetical protein
LVNYRLTRGKKRTRRGQKDWIPFVPSVFSQRADPAWVLSKWRFCQTYYDFLLCTILGSPMSTTSRNKRFFSLSFDWSPFSLRDYIETITFPIAHTKFRFLIPFSSSFFLVFSLLLFPSLVSLTPQHMPLNQGLKKYSSQTAQHFPMYTV